MHSSIGIANPEFRFEVAGVYFVMMSDLFAGMRPSQEKICEDVTLFPSYADTAALMAEIKLVSQRTPFRHMKTPGGHTMSVAMTNCGDYGWISGADGYRYRQHDPQTGQRWPEMPDCFRELAAEVARKADFPGFEPDACLINQYAPGTKLTPHQDKNETDMAHPIVSVSLGVPAVFQLFGESRAGKARSILLKDGDVLVWGGRARLYYHGVKKLESAHHDLTGQFRYNLTFRRAG